MLAEERGWVIFNNFSGETIQQTILSSVIPNDFLSPDCRQGSIGEKVDVLRNELDTAVSERELSAPRMVAHEPKIVLPVVFIFNFKPVIQWNGTCRSGVVGVKPGTPASRFDDRFTNRKCR